MRRSGRPQGYADGGPEVPLTVATNNREVCFVPRYWAVSENNMTFRVWKMIYISSETERFLM